MHVVSLTPQTKYDTACTIDERFKRSRKPLKGISIKNIMFVNFPTPPLQKYINLKELPNKNFSSETRSYPGDFEAEFKKPLASKRDPMGIVWWKKRRSKISWHCPSKVQSNKKNLPDFVFQGSNTARLFRIIKLICRLYISRVNYEYKLKCVHF
jgi:hypothetical protein